MLFQTIKTVVLVALFGGIISLSLPDIVQAQDSNQSLTASDNSTKTQLRNQLAQVKFFSAQFNQQVLDGDGNIVQTASGKLSVNKPNLVHWQTLEPEESLIVSDGKTLWFYDPFVEQVSAHLIEKALVNTPILLLTSSDDSLWQHYSVSSVEPNRYLIQAHASDSQVKSLELRFASSNELTGFTILDVTGQLSIFTLNKVNFNDEPDTKLFQFSLPEGVYLDDQR